MFFIQIYFLIKYCVSPLTATYCAGAYCWYDKIFNVVDGETKPTYAEFIIPHHTLPSAFNTFNSWKTITVNPIKFKTDTYRPQTLVYIRPATPKGVSLYTSTGLPTWKPAVVPMMKPITAPTPLKPANYQSLKLPTMKIVKAASVYSQPVITKIEPISAPALFNVVTIKHKTLKPQTVVFMPTAKTVLSDKVPTMIVQPTAKWNLASNTHKPLTMLPVIHAQIPNITFPRPVFVVTVRPPTIIITIKHKKRRSKVSKSLKNNLTTINNSTFTTSDSNQFRRMMHGADMSDILSRRNMNENYRIASTVPNQQMTEIYSTKKILRQDSTTNCSNSAELPGIGGQRLYLGVGAMPQVKETYTEWTKTKVVSFMFNTSSLMQQRHSNSRRRLLSRKKKRNKSQEKSTTNLHKNVSKVKYVKRSLKRKGSTKLGKVRNIGIIPNIDDGVVKIDINNFLKKIWSSG